MDKPVFRVGDIVEHSKDFIGEIVCIHKEGSLGFYYGPDPETDGMTVDAKDLTLLHRPFQVGDKIEKKNVYKGEWEEATHPKHGAYDSDIKWLADMNMDLFRHLNPLYRTHKDYNPTNPTKEV